MSDSDTYNRREIITRLAFTAAGALTLGPTMAKAIEDSMVDSFAEIARTKPAEYNPRGLSQQSVKDEIRSMYREKSGVAAKRITTALGAFIGYVSHDKSSKTGNAYDRDRDFY